MPGKELTSGSEPKYITVSDRRGSLITGVMESDKMASPPSMPKDADDDQSPKGCGITEFEP